jgi:long-chain fatty acid transport protein
MKNRTTGSCAALCLASSNFSAHGAGLWLYEQGTPDVGTASAGMTSRAQDAATAFANPAGMSRLQGSQLMIGVQPIYSDIESDVDVATFGGGNGGNAGGFVPSGGLFYVYSLSQDLKVGLSAGSYLGLGVDFANDWAGRYYIQKEEFTTVFANGSVGYRVNDWLSVGAGVSAVHGELEYKASLNNVFDGGEDGRLEFDDTDVDIGGNVGVMIEPSQRTRIALTFISKVEFDFTDNNIASGAGPLLDAALRVSGIAGSDTRLKWTLPQH